MRASYITQSEGYAVVTTFFHARLSVPLLIETLEL